MNSSSGTSPRSRTERIDGSVVQCPLETRATIAHTVSQTEEILLDELREWQLTATTTGH